MVEDLIYCGVSVGNGRPHMVEDLIVLGNGRPHMVEDLIHCGVSVR